MKKTLILVVLLSTLVWLMGCASGKSLDGFNPGGGGGTSNFQAGNWAFITAGGQNGAINMGGNLTSSGATVSGHLFVFGFAGTGFGIGLGATSMPVTGNLSNGTLTLSGTISSSNINITFTSVPTTGTITTLHGTYSITGGTDDGDSGTISGEVAGSYTGTWQGTDSTTGGVMTVSLTEATSPNTDGSYTLTASSVTFAGAAGCNVTGTLDSVNSFIAGGIMQLHIVTQDNGIAGDLVFDGGASTPAVPTSISNPASYTYTGGTGCMLQNTNTAVSFPLAKQ